MKAEEEMSDRGNDSLVKQKPQQISAPLRAFNFFQYSGSFRQSYAKHSLPETRL
jgi:hypothetical protein